MKLPNRVGLRNLPMVPRSDPRVPSTARGTLFLIRIWAGRPSPADAGAYGITEFKRIEVMPAEYRDRLATVPPEALELPGLDSVY